MVICLNQAKLKHCIVCCCYISPVSVLVWRRVTVLYIQSTLVMFSIINKWSGQTCFGMDKRVAPHQSVERVRITDNLLPHFQAFFVGNFFTQTIPNLKLLLHDNIIVFILKNHQRKIYKISQNQRRNCFYLISNVLSLLY